MKTSESSRPIGSVATSAVPVLVQMSSISSGNFFLRIALNPGPVAKRLFEAHAREPNRVDDHRALVQAGHELRAEAKAHDGRDDREEPDEEERRNRVVQSEPKERPEEPVGRAVNDGLLLADLAAEARAMPARA